MSQAEIIDEFEKLPSEAQKQVKDYILFLRAQYEKSPFFNKEKTGEIKDEPFIGIWTDRDDLRDSRTWLRTVRKSEWRTPSA